MSYKVLVLMSTYNGERFIKTQLESILNQKGVELNLVIRDDGSKDRTSHIIKEYQRMYSNISLTISKNVGVKKSFKELIDSAPISDYYALADQDDIWYEEKLISAIKKINEKDNEIPQLYFCNQNCVDDNGDFLYKRFGDSNLQPSFFNTIFHNEYSGCTFVFNNHLMEKIKLSSDNFEYLSNIMHDVWIMLIAQLSGNCIYDSRVFMDFRRHGNNVTESKLYDKMNCQEKVKLIHKRFITLVKKWKSRGNMTIICKHLLVVLNNEIDEKDVEKLEYFCNYKSSLLTWTDAVFFNKLKCYFPNPKYRIIIKFLLKVY